MLRVAGVRLMRYGQNAACHRATVWPRAVSLVKSGPSKVVRQNPARMLTSLLMCYPEQSTAISRAVQMARIRVSARRPSRSTNTATETLSTESKFTAERCGTGSEPGSRTTSLASPRMVVVQGATSARRSRGIAASRERTTTGRRPISAISHHHTSPRVGSALTSCRPPAATTLGLPTRRAHQAGACRRRHSSHPPRLIDGEQVRPRGPHQ